MEQENEEYAALARQVRALIKDNKRFLERLQDDDFTPEDEAQEDGEELPVI